METIGKIGLRLESEESRERWELIQRASEEVKSWDALKKAEAYRRKESRETPSEGEHSPIHV